MHMYIYISVYIYHKNRHSGSFIEFLKKCSSNVKIHISMMWVKQQSNCLCREILLSNMHWFADFFNFERLVTLRRKLASGHSFFFRTLKLPLTVIWLSQKRVIPCVNIFAPEIWARLRAKSKISHGLHEYGNSCFFLAYNNIQDVFQNIF